MKRKLILLFFITLLSIAKFASANNSENPVFYPDKEVSVNKPVFIWQDLYYNGDKEKLFFKIQIKKEKNQTKPFYTQLFKPNSFYPDFLSYTFPVILEKGTYYYSIERVNPGNKKQKRFFTYRRYPINSTFNITEAVSPFFKVSEENQVKFIAESHYNKLENKYNSYFYAGASAGSFAIGYLFYAFIDFGIISKIVAYMGFISAGTGAAASGYYGYKYFSKKSELNELLKIDRVSIKSGIFSDKIVSEVSFKY